jgi:SAM-dependent methyltransferase
MAGQGDAHHRAVVEQFTLQADAFSRMPRLTNDLVLAAAAATPTDDVLDVACGPGLLACELARTARRVTGLDLTPAMLDKARARQHELGLGNLTWVAGEAARLPFPDAAFAVVFTRYSFHHLPDPPAAFAEMVRVCRPGGRVVVADVFARDPEQGDRFDRLERLRDPSHVRALALGELTGLFAAAGLLGVGVQLYRHEFALEQVLAGSFPDSPGDLDEVRRRVAEDVGHDGLGLAACVHDGEVRIGYAVAVVAGRKWTASRTCGVPIASHPPAPS